MPLIPGEYATKEEAIAAAKDVIDLLEAKDKEIARLRALLRDLLASWYEGDKPTDTMARLRQEVARMEND
jgi:hypothetical protein